MKIKLFLSAAALLILGLCIAVGNLYLNKPKTAYVDMQKVFSSFEMKKELELRLSSVQDHRKNILDSLELRLRLFSGEIEKMPEKDPSSIKAFNDRRTEFFAKQKEFEQDNDATREQYMSQVLKQLSEYVNNYGKENGYEYIFGADGTGVIMHADDSENISDQVIAYVNTHYKGIK